jgi:hypothetical protein
MAIGPKSNNRTQFKADKLTLIMAKIKSNAK